MKNVQVIDGATNCTFSVFQATEDEFATLFPEDHDMELVEDLVMRVGELAARALLRRLWDRPILKREALGIHGTLFFDNTDRLQHIPPSRREIDWSPGSINPAQRDYFARRRAET